MKALITKNYIYTHFSSGTREQHEQHKKFVKQLTENKGKWIDIDTKYMFKNQYNANFGRIYDTMIDCIKNDVRTDKNVFFVKHPNGKDKIKNVKFKDHLKNERFLSCCSVNGNYYRISRRSNIEFILVGSEIYLTNGIGYTSLKDSNLSKNEIKILKYCANRILKNENLNNLYK